MSAIEDSWGSPSDFFNRVNSVLPESPRAESLRPDTPAVEAIDRLEELGISQLPVVLNRHVLGIFSYRSFAKELASHSRLPVGKNVVNPAELLVKDCVEKPAFAHVSDEVIALFGHLDRNGAVLVGSETNLQGVVTGMDILRHFYRIANPFVLIQEVELALRALIRMVFTAETIAARAKECLANHRAGEPPTRLEDMTFNDFVQLVSDGRTWEHFKPILGPSRVRARARLDKLRDLRNLVFHFKRQITVEEYEDLVEGRDWMLLNARTAEAARQEA